MTTPKTWIDPRLDWVPGKDTNDAKVHLREADIGDLPRLSKLFRRKPQRVMNWIKFNGYSVHVAVRNGRNIVAAVACAHTDDENRILSWWVSSRYEDPIFARRLFALAALEMPEVPTVIVVRKEDVGTEATIRRLGWDLKGISETTNEFRSEPWKPFPVEPGDKKAPPSHSDTPEDEIVAARASESESEGVE